MAKKISYRNQVERTSSWGRGFWASSYKPLNHLQSDLVPWGNYKTSKPESEANREVSNAMTCYTAKTYYRHLPHTIARSYCAAWTSTGLLAKHLPATPHPPWQWKSHLPKPPTTVNLNLCEVLQRFRYHSFIIWKAELYIYSIIYSIILLYYMNPSSYTFPSLHGSICFVNASMWDSGLRLFDAFLDLF